MLRSPSPIYVNGLPVQPLTPRAWAAAIVQLPTLDERRAAMELVPEHWRDPVRTHLINAWHHPQRNKEKS